MTVILEKGVIPPQANFEKINPAIDVDSYNLAVPTDNVPWPSAGVRRVSVNSFGFGGSNTHVILDDALHYLQDRGLAGNHCTLASPPPKKSDSPKDLANGTKRHHGANGNGMAAPEATAARLPTLLVWSAADEKATERTTAGYQAFYAAKLANTMPGRTTTAADKLDRLAWTLAEHRSHLLWRAFAIVDNLDQATLSASKPIRSSGEVGLAFVFTGQGAQYVDMGWDLVRYPVFAECMRRIDAIYGRLGCKWSIFGKENPKRHASLNKRNGVEEMNGETDRLTLVATDKLRSTDNIDKPEYSQPLSTAVQIALLELLKSFGVVPKAVVGHSSGEIAAAYVVPIHQSHLISSTPPYHSYLPQGLIVIMSLTRVETADILSVPSP